MTLERIYILSGTMGSGKSTVLNELRSIGINTINEPARAILCEQRLIGGDGVPEKDSELFTKLLLSRTLNNYRMYSQSDNLCICDRGLPDIIAYAKLFDIDSSVYMRAAKKLKYNKKVFMLPCWEDIYENDDERKMSFAEAEEFSNDLYEIYGTLGYQLIEVPRESPGKRAKFIMGHISSIRK